MTRNSFSAKKTMPERLRRRFISQKTVTKSRPPEGKLTGPPDSHVACRVNYQRCIIFIILKAWASLTQTDLSPLRRHHAAKASLSHYETNQYIKPRLITASPAVPQTLLYLAPHRLQLNTYYSYLLWRCRRTSACSFTFPSSLFVLCTRRNWAFLATF